MEVSGRVWLCLVLVVSFVAEHALAQRVVDKWETIVQNCGVSAMSVALMHNNKLIIYDRTDYGTSPLTFPDGYCRINPNELKVKKDCSAHSIVLDLATNKVKPLKIFSNAWCSSASHRADGTLWSTGGWNDGSTVVRTIGAGPNDDWKDNPKAPNMLLSARWYASNAILPDNRIIVVGGRRAWSYEFQPRVKEGLIQFPFLKSTNTPGAENNLYPFVFLLPDGNLYIHANQDSILFNYKLNRVVRDYPKTPGGPRNYPASGSAVLFPLTAADGYKNAEVFICGGAPFKAFDNVGRKIFDVALQTCLRMVVTAAVPKWAISNMPMPRVMGDMLNLCTGEVLIINGAGRGTAGWNSAKEPVRTPVTYDPVKNRFLTWSPSPIPRMYHSTAAVLPDGKIFVGGSNVHIGYEFKNVEFPTELRLEKYSPYYLNKMYDMRRPRIVTSPGVVKYNTLFKIDFVIAQKPGVVSVRLYAPSFTTHSYSMNQRALVLKFGAILNAGVKQYSTMVTAPPSTVIAPAGYYLMTVLNDGAPSTSAWCKLG